MQTRRSDWKRFTWLDFLLFLPALAAGVCRAISVSNSLTSYPPASELPHTVVLPAIIINAVALGGMYAGPLILGCQFLVRRRRRRLLPGEWLWLSPLIMGAVGKIASE
jgi:hypothetical protein